MPVQVIEEPAEVAKFRSWFVTHGGFIHPHVHYQPGTFDLVDSGFSIISKDVIPEDAEIVSCPLSLVVTPQLSRKALKSVCRVAEDRKDPFEDWTERQLMCTYLCLHWIISGANSELFPLQHLPYLNTLPAPSRLFTPLHFTPAEMSLFRGTNLYSATLDRKSAWQQQHAQCQALISSVDASWGAELSWDRYLTAATYISSRAFPSTLLERKSSLVSTPDSYPVLLPGVDALNHARARPVSWLVSHPPDPPTASFTESKISLVIHTSTPSGSELFNNYGPKPNAELILGYGFTLENNPDDTIVLKIGGSTSNGSQGRWEVGRGARGIEPVWQVILTAVHEADDGQVQTEGADDVDVEEQLYAAEMLNGMAQGLLDKIPTTEVRTSEDVRPEVIPMLSHYIEGQRDILQSIIHFALEKEEGALELAQEQGLNIVEEADNEDE